MLKIKGTYTLQLSFSNAVNSEQELLGKINITQYKHEKTDDLIRYADEFANMIFAEYDPEHRIGIIKIRFDNHWYSADKIIGFKKKTIWQWGHII